MFSSRRSSLLVSIGTLAAAGALVARADEAPPAARSTETCAQQIAARVQAHYESVRDISARFEQTMASSLLGDGAGEAKSSGVVVLRKPGRMRWTYEKPQRHVVVSDGETLWLYDAAAAEVQRLPVTQGYLAGAGLQFLLGEGQLGESFRVSAKRCDAAAPSVDLELHPREAATYERIGLRVRSASGEVLRTSVVDLFGNETHIAFEDLRFNLDPPPETFRFEVPDGVEVIDLVLPR